MFLACVASVHAAVRKGIKGNGIRARVSPTMYIIIVYRVNLNKLSRNFVGAIRTTTTICRVSFIDLYLVFPTNFRIVFYPIQTLFILLEPYCDTITEPGLPVRLSTKGSRKNRCGQCFEILMFVQLSRSSCSEKYSVKCFNSHFFNVNNSI